MVNRRFTVPAARAPLPHLPEERFRAWNQVLHRIDVFPQKRTYVFTDDLRRPGSIRSMKNLIRKFIADETGATAIEYGLIAAGIALVIITAVNGIGSGLKTKFGALNTSLK
jgi:pilus assembly protein Flp/PilA